ncbi:hypothetical protein KFK09_028558 [Dendrobium nobile]|uniref:STAS domain-containing protein n=1 Tax=Dendrobium nobile TaxID=94219 RepID=A0A8T3A3M4_DENNO|nr:hypothetical protein KFK09_028558 [Dendrobium nobile]
MLRRLPGTTVYRSILQYPEAYTYDGMVVARVDAPIYFANTSYIKFSLLLGIKFLLSFLNVLMHLTYLI